MARMSLKKKIEGLEVRETLKVPKDYEETTVRNNASMVGRSLGRNYSVAKDVRTRTFTVIRNA